MHYIFFLVLPMIIAAYVMWRSKGRVTWLEFSGLGLVLAIMVTVVMAVAIGGTTDDTEILNGSIISKTNPQVSCEHFYSCNCRPVSETYQEWVPSAFEPPILNPRLQTIAYGRGSSSSSRSSSRSYSSGSSRRSYSNGSSRSRGHYRTRTRMVTKCDTCYRHRYDISYRLASSLGDTYTIPRIDEQGLQPPPRWTLAYVGEPASKEHSYSNYIKANPGSILNRQIVDARFQNLKFDYPRIEDIYRVQRFLSMGVAIPDKDLWNQGLGNINKDLGAKKQVNVLMVVVNTKDPAYRYTFEHDWVGGKKNDLIVLVGVSQYPKIDWVRIVSWSPAEDLKVELRDTIQNLGALSKRDEILTAIREHTDKQYRRMQMKSYKYLMLAYEPPLKTFIWMAILSILLTAGILWWSWANDFTADRVGW